MRDKDKEILKIDFNLLMSGTWVLQEREAKIELFEKDLNGGKIIISSPYGVPKVKDSKLLDFLMMASQDQDWSKVIDFPSLSYLSKSCKFSSKNNFEELKKSLSLLKRLVIEFHSCFVDTGVLKYFSGFSEVIEIGILQGYQIKKTKVGRSYPVKVVFDDNFLTLCKHSMGYKLITYAPIRELRDTAYALYKWAYRWYDSGKGSGERWIGDGKSLVKWYKNELNSAANYKYPSKVLERVNSAIEQLNSKESKVPFSFELKQVNGKYKMVMRAKDCVIKIKTNQCPYDNLPKLDKDALLNYIKDNKKYIKNPCGFLKSLSNKELDIFLRRVKGKKVLVNAGSRMEEEPKEQSLKGKLFKVLKAHGVNDFLYSDNGDSFSIFPAGANADKIKEFNTNRELIDALSKITGLPVKVM